MSQTLTIQISDQAYSAIRAEADSFGVPPLQIVTQTLERHFCDDVPRTETEKQAARARFESHFGEIDLGMRTGSDNNSIDADLASELVSNHEAE